MGGKTFLLQTFIIDKKELSKEFVQYDTSIIGGGNYELPTGKLIVLLLKTGGIIPVAWTTIRRFTEEKYKYYKSQEGKEFNIVVG